ncbi:MAG: hypothetical protein ACRDZR_00020 [Acidimicrobiales bacterium]
MATTTKIRSTQVDDRVLRARSAHRPYATAQALGVDIVTSPNLVDDDDLIYARLARAADPVAVYPGKVVTFGKHGARWRGRVVAWDFELSDDDPTVLIEFREALRS